MVNTLKIQTRKSLDFRFFIVLLFAIVAISFGLVSFTYKMAIIGIIAITWFAVSFAIMPRGAFLFLLLIRPSVDVFRSFGLKFGPVATLNVNAVLAILVIVLGAFFLLIHKHNFLDNKVSRFFLLYLGFTLAWGIFVSKNRLNFSAVFLRQLSFFVVFCLSFRLFNRNEQIRKLTTVCIMASVVPLAIAFQQVIKRGLKIPLSLSSIEGVHPGVQGPFSTPGGWGIYLALLLLICFGFLLTETKKTNVLKWIAVGGILYSFLILTYFRTAWIGFLGALVAISLLKYRKLSVPILLLVLISLVIAPSILQRLPQLSSWYWRVRLWNRIFLREGNMIDYIFGRGLGSISVLMHDRWGISGVTSHNTYLKMLFETGILGICLFLSIKLLLLKTAYNLLGKDKPRCVRAVSITVFGMSIFLFIAYIAQTIVGPAVMWYYWVYAGALYGMESQFKKEKMINFFDRERIE